MTTPLKPKSNRVAGVLLALLFVALTLMFMIRGCSHRLPEVPGPAPSGGDTIDVAIEYGPLSLYRYDDTLGGFAYDFLRSIGEAEGIVFKFHPVTTLNEALRGIDDGYYRLVVAAMPLSASLSRDYASTRAVFLDRQVLVQMRSDSDSVAVTSPLDLAHKTVWVMAGSPVAERLHNLAAEIGDTINVVEDAEYGNEQLFILAATGEIPGAVVTERTAKLLARDYPRADISTAVSFTQFQSWLLAPGDTLLLSRLDSIITRHQSRPSYKAIHDRYL